MPTANLAIVFAPSILRPREESIVQIVSDAPFVNAVLQSLLDDPKLLAVVWSRFSLVDVRLFCLCVLTFWWGLLNGVVGYK